jgi:hypothetical protein
MELLFNYLPKSAHPQIEVLLKELNIDIKITKERITKHGDFRFYPNKKPIITINQSLNPYRFLITLLHELAHFKVFQNYKSGIKPHGKEWKRAYREIVFPFLNPEIFPNPICSTLAKHMINPKASTDRDFELVMALKAFDDQQGQIHIYELQEGAVFQISNGRRFIKIKKRRKRFECKEISSGRTYIFSPHVEVIPE